MGTRSTLDRIVEYRALLLWVKLLLRVIAVKTIFKTVRWIQWDLIAPGGASRSGTLTTAEVLDQTPVIYHLSNSLRGGVIVVPPVSALERPKGDYLLQQKEMSS